jgi:hypothetical protein
VASNCAYEAVDKSTTAGWFAEEGDGAGQVTGSRTRGSGKPR